MAEQSIKPWGQSVAIDLHGCEHDRLTDPKLLEEFVINTIELIGMVRHGQCYIDRFAEGNLEGWSAMQFLKTSSITVHLDEHNNRAFIDIFSCKEFDTKPAEQYAQEFFKAKSLKATSLLR